MTERQVNEFVQGLRAGIIIFWILAFFVTLFIGLFMCLDKYFFGPWMLLISLFAFIHAVFITGCFLFEDYVNGSLKKKLEGK